MKKIIRIVPLILFAGLVACGGAEEGIDANNPEGGGDEAAQESKAEFADVVSLNGKTELDNVEFNRLVNFMEEAEVTLTGYPYAYPLGEGTEIEFEPGRTDLIDGIDNSVDNCGISVKFKDESDPIPMKIGDLLAIKGKLRISYSNGRTRIILEDAEFVDGATEKGGTLKSIEEINTAEQIFCGDLHKVMNDHYASIAKSKMTVTGKYLSTTISKGLDGDTLEVRIDLGDYDNKVGCEMISEPDSDMLTQKRSNGKPLSFVGTFSATSWSGVRISECTVK